MPRTRLADRNIARAPAAVATGVKHRPPCATSRRGDIGAHRLMRSVGRRGDARTPKPGMDPWGGGSGVNASSGHGKLKNRNVAGAGPPLKGRVREAKP